MIRRIETSLILDEISAPANSEAFLVEDFRHSVLQFFLTAATGTFKVKVSNAESVDFSAASTPANPWYYVDLKGLGDGATTVVGSTGFSTTTETSTKGYAVNVDLAKWVGVEASALSAGTVSVQLSRATNE